MVIGGLVGQKTREEGAVTGRVLNLAARIQTQAAPNALMVPAEMKAFLGNIFENSDLGRAELLGVLPPQRILQLVRAKTAETCFA